MRAPIALAALALAVAAAPARAESTFVSMADSSFSPARLDVLVGDSVVWRNTSLRTHDIQSLSAGFDSGRVARGESFGHAFGTPGTFAFVCTIHDGMTGELTVHPLLLRGPERAVPRGMPVTLRVRAPEGVTEVSLSQTSCPLAPPTTARWPMSSRARRSAWR
jgi:plastocyanin